MAHFAQIENGTVTQVIFVANDYAPTEAAGQAFIASIGLKGQWIQTSYNTHYVYEYEFDDSEPPQVIGSTFIGSAHSQGGTPFRGKYAGIGDLWNGTEFVSPEANDETV